MDSVDVTAGNLDAATVSGFGDEWSAYDQTGLTPEEHRRLFDTNFSLFPFADLPPNAEGFDLGCGSGRWAALMAERVGLLHCIDPAEPALEVARRRLGALPTVRLHLAGSETMPLAPASQDFGYSLGVLHHIPDTESAMRDCVDKLKPGAPFLVYLYYRFDNRPAWFRGLWRLTDLARRGISRLPFGPRRAVSTIIAGLIYWPLARTAAILDRLGVNIDSFPLSSYRDVSFYGMRTDALDRFGTRLEQRFTRAEIQAMMSRCGLEDIRFGDGAPYWLACGRRSRAA